MLWAYLHWSEPVYFALLWACLLCSEPVWSALIMSALLSALYSAASMRWVQDKKLGRFPADIILETATDFVHSRPFVDRFEYLRARKEAKSENWGRFRKLYFGSWDKKQNQKIGGASESRILTIGIAKLENGGRFPRYYFGCWDGKIKKLRLLPKTVLLRLALSWHTCSLHGLQ